MLGIITHAVVKIFRCPRCRNTTRCSFRRSSTASPFSMTSRAKRRRPPACVSWTTCSSSSARCSSPRPRASAAAFVAPKKLFVTKLKGFDVNEMVACTLVFEGSREQVGREEAAVRRLTRRHGGMRAGAENGKKGYQLTFGIAYFRDFIMRHYILGESFETSVPWSQALSLCANVKRRLTEEYVARKLPGIPFITARVTQLYQTGVAVYFYFGFYHKGVERPAEVYAELEHAARDEILRSGGSLSHHHGVGKIRRAFLPRVFSNASLEWAADVKRAVDPTNTFGIANQ